MWWRWWQRFRTYRWQRQPEVRQLCSLMAQWYADVDAHVLAQNARQQHGLNTSEYTYGEIEPLSFAALLQRIRLQPGDVFYDLGSGSGRAVLTVALWFTEVRCVGIEKLAELYQLSQRVALQAPEQVRQRITWRHDDILSADFADANLLWVNATGFFAQAWQQLQQNLLQVQSGCYVMISTKRLCAQEFSLVYQTPLAMSWGFATIRVYRRH